MERATQERLVGASLLIVAGVIMIPWLLDGKTGGPELAQRELVLPGGTDNGNETRLIPLDLPGQSASARAPGAANQPVRELDSRTVKDVDQPSGSLTLPAPKAVSTTAPAEPPNAVASTSEVPARFRTPMADSKPAAAAPSAATRASTRPAMSTPEPAPAERSPAAAVTPPVTEPAEVAKPKPAPVVADRTPAPAAVPATAAQASTGWAVQVGSFASQDNAQRLVELLKGKSYKAFVARNVIDGRVRYRVRVGPVAQRSEAELLATALREDRQPARVLSHP